MHKNTLFLLKIAKIAQRWGLTPSLRRLGASPPWEILATPLGCTGSNPTCCFLPCSLNGY